MQKTSKYVEEVDSLKEGISVTKWSCLRLRVLFEKQVDESIIYNLFLELYWMLGPPPTCPDLSASAKSISFGGNKKKLLHIWQSLTLQINILTFVRIVP